MYQNEMSRKDDAFQLKVDFKKVLYTMPLLFLSGIFTGVAIILSIS